MECSDYDTLRLFEDLKFTHTKYDEGFITYKGQRRKVEVKYDDFISFANQNEKDPLVILEIYECRTFILHL